MKSLPYGAYLDPLPTVMASESVKSVLSNFCGFKETKVAIIISPMYSFEIWKTARKFGWKQIDDSHIIFDPLCTPEEIDEAIAEKRQISSFLRLIVFEVR